MPKIYGYAKTHDKDPDATLQINALIESGEKSERIHTDARHGEYADRETLHLLLKKMQAGDMLVVKSIEVLVGGNSLTLYRDPSNILKNWNRVTKEIGADIKVLDTPLLNTRLHKKTTGTYTAELVSCLLSLFTQRESAIQEG
jgi:hypothetical protein